MLRVADDVERLRDELEELTLLLLVEELLVERGATERLRDELDVTVAEPRLDEEPLPTELCDVEVACPRPEVA